MKKLFFLLIFCLFFTGCAPKISEGSTTVPILLYHHINEEGDDGSAISVTSFRRQMELIRTEGYNPISLDALIDFAEKGTPLPEKPMVITFDDGYYSNYQYAYPILKEYGYPATIFAIGCSVGHMEFYKDTTHTMTPHFGEAEIRVMEESGLISVQSHTYDMHQWAPFETGDRIRENALPLENESEADYIAALTADHLKISALLDKEIQAVAYPHGKSSTLSNQTLQGLGVKVTLTTDGEKVNALLPNQPEGLIDLGRFSINETITDAEFLKYLKK